MTGEAFEMRVRLRRLMAEHRVVHEPYVVPMIAPTACAQVVEGFAMTPDVDADRCRFRGHAFGLVRKATPLLFRHDPNQVAGEIEELKYTDRGALYVRARVDHPEARRCNAFSVGGRVISYRLHNADTPDFFAEVEDAELSEISLTDSLANANAIVTRRYPASSLPKYFDLQIARIDCIRRYLELLPQVMAAAAAKNKGSNTTIISKPRDHGTSRVRPRTSFGELADALNNRLEA